MKDVQARIRITYGYYLEGCLSEITKIAELMAQVDIVSPHYIHSSSDPVYVISDDDEIDMQVNVKPAICRHSYDSLVAAHKHNSEGGNEYDD